MADQPNVFENNAVVTPQATSSDPQYADLLNGIKNESGAPKYDSVPKALEGLANAQQYIPELKSKLSAQEQEILALKAELDKRAAVEDVVTRLTAQQSQPQGQGQPTATSGLDEQAVLQLVQSALGQAKQADQAKMNQAQVQQALATRYGEKANEVVVQKAQELGTTPKQLGELASQNPALVLALFNASAQPGVKPTTGSVTIPASYMSEKPTLGRPEKSLLSGATSKEQAEFMRRIKEEVYAKYDVKH